MRRLPFAAVRESGLLEAVERLVVAEHRALYKEVLGEPWSPSSAYRWIRYEDPDPLARLADATNRLDRVWAANRVGFQERTQLYGAAEESELDRLEPALERLETRPAADEEGR